MTARAALQRLAREYAEIDPEREVCTSCRGGGQGDYGVCDYCDGEGSWPIETTRRAETPVRDRRTPAEWIRDIRAAHDVIAFGLAAE